MIIIKNVNNDFVNRDFSKKILIRKEIHKIINVTANIGEMGLYIKEKEAKPIMPVNQPNKFIPAMITIRINNNSFLLMT